jgi:hypothetical protein
MLQYTMIEKFSNNAWNISDRYINLKTKILKIEIKKKKSLLFTNNSAEVINKY